MDPSPELEPLEAIERAISELRRSGGRRHSRPEHTQQHGSQRGPFFGKGAGHEHPFASMARYRLLSVLDRLGDGASVSELADAIHVDQPRASRVVADCVARGLATRSIDPTDARRSVIALADAGRAVLDERRRERRSAVEAALQGFSPDERQQFAALLTRFVDAAREATR